MSKSFTIVAPTGVGKTTFGVITALWMERKKKRSFSSFLIDGRRLEVEGEIQADKTTVEEINKVEEEMMPLPPHTTDTALSEISRVLKVSANEVMALLQELFEHGFITYHRTDSTRISQVGQSVAQKIFQRLGLDVFKGRNWASGEEGAHEAIRPAKAVSPDEIMQMLEEGVIKGITRRHVKAYEMIYKRFLQSQARAVRVRKQKVKLRVGSFVVKDEVVAEILENG